MPASRLNLEYDSRILRTSVGHGGAIRPQLADTSHLPENGTWCPHCPPPGPLDKLFCLSCGKEGSAVTAGLPPALAGRPGVIWICNECESKKLKLPTTATSYESLL